MPFSIATWNINSVRLREPIVARLLKAEKPDILCLQEIKCREDQFPLKGFAKLGYTHVAIHGQTGYHGVATLSRHPFAATERQGFCGKGDARHIAVTVDTKAGPLTVDNFYIPSGGDIPDPAENDKFAHKLSFLEEFTAWGAERANGAGRVAVGDFNIAPHPDDVWSHKQLLKVVSHTPVETEALNRAQVAGSWSDIVRHHLPVPEKVFTWWSYRARDWSASNRGRRLDHIWSDSATAERSTGVRVLRDARDWPKPSDHVPVIATFDF